MQKYKTVNEPYISKQQLQNSNGTWLIVHHTCINCNKKLNNFFSINNTCFRCKHILKINNITRSVYYTLILKCTRNLNHNMLSFLSVDFYRRFHFKCSNSMQLHSPIFRRTVFFLSYKNTWFSLPTSSSSPFLHYNALGNNPFVFFFSLWVSSHILKGLNGFGGIKKMLNLSRRPCLEEIYRVIPNSYLAMNQVHKQDDVYF